MDARLQLREVAVRGKRGIDEKLCEAARRKREMDERLCEAVILGGNTATLSQLLQGDPSILGGDYERTDHPVHLGAMFGHADVLTEILNQEPALTRKLNSKGQSPPHLASERGHVQVVKAILSIDADVSFVRDNDGRIPLHLAAINGHVEVLKLLVVAKKITAWLLTNERDPLLHLCANHAQFEAVKTLVQCVKDDTFVGLKNSKGDTILHVLSDMSQAEMIEFLLKNITTKQQINDLNANMLTALDVVEQKRWERNYWELKLSLVKGGAKTSKDLRTRQPSTYLGWKSSEHYSNWLEAKENTILVVAVLIATVTFDAVRNPPGGLWQDSKDKYIAGESILSSTNHLSYFIFSFSNQAAFFASSSAILFMLIKARIPAKHLVWMLVVSMWIGIGSMWIAFVSALYSIGTGAKKTKNLQNLTCMFIYTLVIVALVITWFMACFRLITSKIGPCRGHGERRNQIP